MLVPALTSALLLSPWGAGSLPEGQTPRETAVLPTLTGAQGGASHYQVGPEDVLSIRVFGEDELSGEYLVNDAGRIDFPLIGLIDAAGMTPQELGQALRGQLADGYLKNPQVTVSVTTSVSQPVQILGAVAQPGIYYTKGQVSLLSLLSQAGGLEDGEAAEIRILHPGESPVVVNLRQLIDSGEGNLALRPGDTVYVPDERAQIYVSGMVEKPGPVAYRKQITVTQVLSEAGGPRAEASLQRIYILRNGQPIHVDLRKIQRGQDPDVALEAGDHLIVGESVF